MSPEKNFLDRLVETLFVSKKDGPKTHWKKRSLGLESLEAREMLSVNPLPPPADPADDSPGLYAPLDAPVSSDWIVEVEASNSYGNESPIEILPDPMTPSGLSTVGYNTVAIQCHWNAVDGAVSYHIQRSTDGASWTAAGTSATNSFIDWNRFTDDTFHYRVASVDGEGVVSEWSSPAAGNRSVTLDSPELEISSQNDRSVTLQWTPVDNAQHYEVYRSTDDGRSWVWTANSTTSHYVYGPPAYSVETDYQFKVRAVAKPLSGTVTSAYGNICTTFESRTAATDPPERPTGLRAAGVDSTTILVSWNASRQADSYTLEGGLSEDGPWTVLYEGTETSFSHMNVDDLSYHYYRVSASSVIGSSDFSSAIAGKSLFTPSDPSAPTGLSLQVQDYGGFRVSWDGVDGAASYRIQWSIDGSNWTGYGTLSTTSFLNTNAATFLKGTIYFFRVASIDSNGVLSEFSDVLIGRNHAVPDTPNLEVASRTENTIRLRWNAVEGAFTYAVRVSTDGGASWKSLLSAHCGTEYVYDISGDPGAEYRFRICVARTTTAMVSSAFGDEVVSLAADRVATLPERPDFVTARPASATEIDVSWASVIQADRYRVETTDLESGVWTTVYEGSETTFRCAQLDAESWYRFRVTAINDVGESAVSHVATARTEAETARPILYDIRRDGPGDRSESLTVYYRLSGTARIGLDFTVSNGFYDTEFDYGTITIPAGRDVVTLRLDILEGTAYNPERSVLLTLLSGVPGGDDILYGISGTGTAEAWIEENGKEPAAPTSPTVRIESTHGGIEGGCDGLIRLRRDSTEGVLTVYFALDAAGTARYGEDFTVSGAEAAGNLWSVTFEEGREYADVAINVIHDDLSETSETISIRLLQDTGQITYLLGDVTQATLSIHEQAMALPVAANDHYYFSPSDTGLFVSANVLDNDFLSTGGNIDPSSVSVLLLGSSGIENLVLNEDGRFECRANHAASGGFFLYKILTNNGLESGISVVTIGHSNSGSIGNLLTKLEGSENPQVYFDEEGNHVLSNSENSATITGIYRPGLLEKNIFVPEIVGTYEIHHSEDNRDTGEDVRTVQIVSEAYDNGDWTYTEIVSKGYDLSNTSGTSAGESVYAFVSWKIGDDTGYMSYVWSYDEYFITEPASSSDFVSTTSGFYQAGVFQGYWNQYGIGYEYEHYVSSSESSGNGSYSYDISGGTVTGNQNESHYAYEFEETQLYLTFDEEEEMWRALTGAYLSKTNGWSQNAFEGDGIYEIDEDLSDENTNGVSHGYGEIHENGSEFSSYSYEINGAFINDTWSTNGIGTTESKSSSFYLNTQHDEYSLQWRRDDLESAVQGKDERYFSEEYSVTRDGNWLLVNSTWTMVSGKETESGATETRLSSVSEEKGTLEDPYEPIVTRIDIEAKSEKKDDYELARIWIGENWQNDSGSATSLSYEFYSEDHMTGEGTYEKAIHGGRIEGDYGDLSNCMNESCYESRLIIGNTGDWILDEGEGYYRFQIGSGSYSKGSGSYSIEDGNGMSLSGNITEEWKQTTGKGGRTEFSVDHGTWIIESDHYTNTSWYKNEEKDIADGSLIHNGVIGEYSHNVLNRYSDEREVYYESGETEPRQGTITNYWINIWDSSFEGSAENILSNPYWSVTGMQNESFEQHYQSEKTIKWDWIADDNDSDLWELRFGTWNEEYSDTSKSSVSVHGL